MTNNYHFTVMVRNSEGAVTTPERELGGKKMEIQWHYWPNLYSKLQISCVVVVHLIPEGEPEKVLEEARKLINDMKLHSS